MTHIPETKDAPLDYPFEEPPEEGTVREVAPGIHWIRMPLPFALDHINLWVLDDGDAWTLVDTGFSSRRTRAVWETLLAGPLAGRPVRRVVITHCHPDHIGMGGWLAETTGAPLWATRSEWYLHKTLIHDDGDLSQPHALAYYRAHGAAEEWLEEFSRRPQTYRNGVCEAPAAYHRLRAGESLEIGGRAWEILVGEGHSPEHACLHDAAAGVLISGDQVLPRITSNISVWPTEPDADPLGDYLDTNRQFLDLPADTLVLPSHGLPFRGLHARIRQIAEHHQLRLAHLAQWLGEPCTAVEAMATLFPRKLDAFQSMFAIGETVAHLNRLVYEGRIERLPGDDGLIRFRSATG